MKSLIFLFNELEFKKYVKISNLFFNVFFCDFTRREKWLNNFDLFVWLLDDRLNEYVFNYFIIIIIIISLSLNEQENFQFGATNLSSSSSTPQGIFAFGTNVCFECLEYLFSILLLACYLMLDLNFNTFCVCIILMIVEN